MCEQCYKANIVEGKEALQSLPNDCREVVGDVVFMLLPSANTFDLSDPTKSIHRVIPLSHIMQDFYFKPELEAILGLFWPLPMPGDMDELKSLIRERVTYVAGRQARAVLNHSWDRVLGAAPVHAEALDAYFDVKGEFGPALDILPPEFDWNKAISAFLDYLAAAHSDPHPSLPKSHAQLAAEQLALTQREDAARASRISGRYAEIAEWYTYLLDDHLHDGEYSHDMMPNMHDGTALWAGLVLEDDARAPLDVDSVMGESNTESVIWALRDYPCDVMRSLGEKVERRDADAEERCGKAKGKGKGRKGKEVYYEGPEDVALRPTALFQCAECGDFPHGWPEINAHWREKHPDESVWIISGHGREEYKAGVWEEGVDVAEMVLAVLVEQGLGKRDRNKTRLDELIEEGCVFCACGDPTMATPDNGLNWASLVKHVFSHLKENARRILTPPQTACTGEVAVVWIDDHDLESCIKFVPKAGIDLAQASYRFEADPNSRARVSTYFAQCPEKSQPLCSLCDELTPEDKKDYTLFLPECADAVLYHMQARHGKCFQEQDVVFVEETVLKQAWPVTHLYRDLAI
ncbi:hypothetical protein GSI_03162 [Ganoderma sinense ZZ0214-1]|uniref:Uncharacterized protein n=1 Tax=Ganoderma sinense ZZ0214-1 TaxID=1077348 RepID=A0A2G8SKV6_9APHY|nr:hypothetical protein GSI_03162 [Ganoderma sinense ZZ0214-1]